MRNARFVDVDGANGRQLVGLGLLGLWLVGMSVVVVTFMAGHWYTLPKPERERPEVAQRLQALRGTGEQAQWLIVHALYAQCGCSQRIFEHLFSSERPVGVAEHVLLVGQDEALAARSRRAGFSTHVLEPAELKARFALQAAPLLLVVDPAGRLRYAGGYTARKRGPDIRDKAIIGALRAQEHAPELPLFGCAVSAGLQRLLDPLGIKYQEQ